MCLRLIQLLLINQQHKHPSFIFIFDEAKCKEIFFDEEFKGINFIARRVHAHEQKKSNRISLELLSSMESS